MHIPFFYSHFVSRPNSNQRSPKVVDLAAQKFYWRFIRPFLLHPHTKRKKRSGHEIINWLAWINTILVRWAAPEYKSHVSKYYSIKTWGETTDLFHSVQIVYILDQFEQQCYNRFRYVAIRNDLW